MDVEMGISLNAHPVLGFVDYDWNKSKVNWEWVANGSDIHFVYHGRGIIAASISKKTRRIQWYASFYFFQFHILHSLSTSPVPFYSVFLL
jgi:hypothetical protein